MANPERSEWGKINDGQHWRPFALDFGRAFFGATWPAHTLPLMFHVIERSWAPYAESGKRADAVPVAINFYDLATKWGVPAQRLYEARKWLVSRGVWAESEDGYTMTTDPERWGVGDPDSDDFRPFLSEEIVKYAKLAQNPKSKSKGSSHNDTSCTPQRATPQRATEPDATPQRATTARPSVQRLHAPACNDYTPQRAVEPAPPAPPIGERPRKIRDLEIKDKLAGGLLSQETDSEMAGLIADAREILEHTVNTTAWVKTQVHHFGFHNVKAVIRKATDEEDEIRHPRKWMTKILEDWQKDGTDHTPKPKLVENSWPPYLPKSTSKRRPRDVERDRREAQELKDRHRAVMARGAI